MDRSAVLTVGPEDMKKEKAPDPGIRGFFDLTGGGVYAPAASFFSFLSPPIWTRFYRFRPKNTPSGFAAAR